MRRTTIYLSAEQLDALRRVRAERNVPVAELVREAVDEWLRSRGGRPIPKDEWERRFDTLLRRRDAIAKELDVSEEEVERDVTEAVREVRRPGAERR